MGLFGLEEGGFEAVAGDEEDEEGHGGDDDRDVVGLAEDGDEVGHEVERGDQVGDKGDEDDPGRAADAAVAKEGAAGADAAAGGKREEAASTLREAQSEVGAGRDESEENEDGGDPAVPGHGAMVARRAGGVCEAAARAGRLLLRSVDYSGDPTVEQPDRTRPRPHQGGRHRNVERDRR